MKVLGLLPAERKSMDKKTMILNKRPETDLETHDFYYDLPEELIAQFPSEERDGCRLMVLDRENKKIEHKIFRDIIDYLRPEDMLVVNSSKVIPARLLGVTEKTGSSMELLLLRILEDGTWETLVRPGKRAKVGARFNFADILRAEVLAVVEGGNRIVRFEYDTEKYKSIYEVLDEIGNMPLPPYITKKLENKSDYQTVYAKEEGSAAAPTAGLHFTDELLAKIREKGVGYGEVTLHVGLGTFRPVKAEKLADHEMHGEYFHIEREVADEINRRRAMGGRIIAVGTTSCRVLESVATDDGIVHPISGETGIFIYPGYKFKAIDALITNFHLPESTLIMLVSALAGKEFVMDAYKEAVSNSYRFFSFGDAMFIE
jgi:S-adenosylmethionine:tRNA ribosyltransferase-isomerase